MGVRADVREAVLQTRSISAAEVVTTSVSRWTIRNPKRDRSSRSGRSTWYPYYAGFSPDFAGELLASIGHVPITVADPWNGSGTTTSVSSLKGHEAYGFDLNPVMVVVAKARLIDSVDSSSLLPLARDILGHLDTDLDSADPLLQWFVPKLAAIIRALQRSTIRLLADQTARSNVSAMSPIACFFHVALFSVVRELTSRFRTSNPTWVRRPSLDERISGVSRRDVRQIFLNRVQAMTSADSSGDFSRPRRCVISEASSASLPMESESVDLVLGSPPYCTRIDYAIATLTELAVLGRSMVDVDVLRRKLIGTSTVDTEVGEHKFEWGRSCATLLARIFTHKSRASNTYYYKNHLQYFDGLFRSMVEIARILRVGGNAALVVQDSYYKNVKNDLGNIVVEMGEATGLRLVRRVNFRTRASMLQLNTRASSVSRAAGLAECVICLVR